MFSLSNKQQQYFRTSQASAWYIVYHMDKYIMSFSFHLKMLMYFFKETTILMCRALGLWDYLNYRGLFFFFFQVKAAAYFKYVRDESQQCRNEMFKKFPSPVSNFKAGLCLGQWQILRGKNALWHEEESTVRSCSDLVPFYFHC